MQNWKFFLGVAITVTLLIFLVSLIPGAELMLEKIWEVIWKILQFVFGVVISVWLICGSWVYGFLANYYLMPAIDKKVEENVHFFWYHYLVASIVFALAIAILQEVSVLYCTFIPPMPMLIEFTHPNSFTGVPGVWETLPVFWPIYSLIIGGWGLYVGYDKYRRDRRNRY